jgi:hypothetical protein
MPKASFISNNYSFLTRGFNGPGVKIHSAVHDEEFVTLTFMTCKSNDEYEIVRDHANENEAVIFRILIGDSDISLVKKIENGSEMTIQNLPVKVGQEVWVSCDVPNAYCVYGFTNNYPMKQ